MFRFLYNAKRSKFGSCHRNVHNALRAAFLLLFVTIYSSAEAVQLGPENFFSAVTNRQEARIKEITKLKVVQQVKNPRFLQFKFQHSGATFHVLRIEGAYCKELCYTAFFENEMSDDGFAGLGLFPPKAVFGDVLPQMPGACRNALTLYFVFSTNKQRGVIFSKCGVTF